MKNRSDNLARNSACVAALLCVHADAIAVPEPATYALFIAGLGAMAFVSRRRWPRR